MTNVFALKVFLEVGAVLLLIYGIYREQDLVSLEDRVWKKFLIVSGIQARRDAKAAAARKAEARRRAAIRRKQQAREQAAFEAWERQANRAEANRRAAAALQQRKPARRNVHRETITITRQGIAAESRRVA